MPKATSPVRKRAGVAILTVRFTDVGSRFGRRESWTQALPDLHPDTIRAAVASKSDLASPVGVSWDKAGTVGRLTIAQIVVGRVTVLGEDESA